MALQGIDRRVAGGPGSLRASGSSSELAETSTKSSPVRKLTVAVVSQADIHNAMEAIDSVREDKDMAQLYGPDRGTAKESSLRAYQEPVPVPRQGDSDRPPSAISSKSI